MPEEKNEKEEKKSAGLPVPTPGEGMPPVPSEAGGPPTPTGNLSDKMPDIPSFRPGATDAGKNAAGGMGLFGRGSAGSAGMKLRGLANSSSLIERLKQLRKKDLIFIASGLSVLMLAPLAEHFVLGPGEDSNVLKQGFDSKNGTPFNEMNPYETGTGMATGNLPGQSSDVITPLNVRDPMSLIFGAGAQQPGAAAGGAGAGTGSTSGASKEGWKDAISEASRAGARTAIDSGGLPSPKGNLAGSLRGLSALSGSSYGGGPSFNLGPISGAVGGKGGGTNMPGITGGSGIKGVARSNTSASSIDALKAAADRAAGAFNGPRSAADSLSAAAREAIPTGGTGGSEGGPGKGQDGKNPGGNTSKDTKSMGESLAFLRAKMEMEKAVDLKWKKIEWETFGRQKMIQEEMIKMGFDILKKGVAAPFTKKIAGIVSAALGVEDKCFECDIASMGGKFKVCSSNCSGVDKDNAATEGDACKYFNLANDTGLAACKPVGGASAGRTGPPTPDRSGDAECMSRAGCAGDRNRRSAADRAKTIEETRKASCQQDDSVCQGCARNTTQLGNDVASIQTYSTTAESQLSTAKSGMSLASQNLDSLSQKLAGARQQINTVIASGGSAYSYLTDATAVAADPTTACTNAKNQLTAARNAYQQAEPVLEECRQLLERANTGMDQADTAMRGANSNITEGERVLAGDQGIFNDVNSNCSESSRLQQVWAPTTARTNTDRNAASKAIATDRNGDRTGSTAVDGYNQFDAKRTSVRTQLQDLTSTCNQIVRAKVPTNPRSIASFNLDCESPTAFTTQANQLNGYNTRAENELRRPFIEHNDPPRTNEAVTGLFEPHAAQLVQSR